MKPVERVRAALAMAEVDRPPFAFWTHMPGIDLDPVRLAEETAAFARRYHMDFVKSMPNGLYCVEDWGCECDYGDIAGGGVARVTRAAIRQPDDWRALRRVDVHAGAFGRELAHLSRLVRLAGNDQPVLATVFSPLTIAAKLSEGLSRSHRLTHPDHLAEGLETIAAVTREFARAAIDAGCAGVFLATQDATRSLMTEADYASLAAARDLSVLDAARSAGGWFNVIHMHGEDIHFDLLSTYDVHAVNWHIGETPPALGDYRARPGSRAILGGLRRGHITTGHLDGIRQDVEAAERESGGRGLLLGPACTIRHPVDPAVLEWTARLICRD